MGLRDLLGWGDTASPVAVDKHGLALTASSTIVDLTDRSEAARITDKGLTQLWHADAWTYRRAIGEVRFGQNWMGTAVSRMRLFVAALVPGEKDPVPVEDAVSPPPGSSMTALTLPDALVQDAQDVMAALGDTAPLLERATVNLEVVGEFRLVGYVDELGTERWECRSVGEVVRTEDGYVLRGRPGTQNAQAKPRPTSEGGTLLDPADSYLARVWRSDAQWTDLSDSPMSGVLDRCEELLLLGRKVRNSARSRIPAGLFALPSEVQFEGSVDDDGNYVEPPDVEDVLTEAFSTAISDETSPSALVPIIFRAPADKLDALRRVDLGRGSDPEDAAERAEALGRVLQGLDFPPEIVTGFKDVKYANAQAIDKGTFRDHVEPKVLTINHALTHAYLRPRLLGLGWDRELVNQLVVWHDPSDLVADVDQSDKALAVYNAGQLSGDALRRLTGFGDADAPTDEDRAWFLLVQGKQPATPVGGTGGPTGVVPDPSVDSQPAAVRAAAARAIMASASRPALTAAGPTPTQLGRQLLDVDLRLFDRLQGAADLALARVLEKAGSRARSKARPSPSYDGDLARLVWTLEQAGQPVPADDDLVTGDPFGDLARRFQDWTAQAFEQALRRYCHALGLRYTPPEQTTDAVTAAGELDVRFSDLGGLDLVSLRERAQRDRIAASDRLREQLTALALERLHQPDPVVPDDGEHDPTTTVPPGLLRAAVTRAGGADSATQSAGVDDNGRPVQDEDGPPGGVATGRTLRDAAGLAGLPAYAYTWVHGGAGRPFDPHLELDGGEFVDQGDRRLTKDPAAWPRGTTSWFPGDHPGCTCWTEYLFTDPFAGLSQAEARSVRARQQARDERGRYVARRDHPDDTPGGPTTPRARQ